MEESQFGKKKGKLIGRDVVWVKPSMWKREYQLLADGDHMASMWFERWYNNVATVEGLGQRWTFNRKGWLQQQVVAEDDDLYKEALPFRYSWSGGGTLYLDDGSTLKFKNGFWGSKSYWQTVNGENVITFYKKSWWRSAVNVDFHPTAAAYSELPVLIFLGFYLRTLHEQDAAAAAAT
jgi:hypothetical protein